MSSALPISIALCTYNGARHLSQQLESISGQTRLPGELVVTDDGSTDESVLIVEEFSKTAPFPVRVYRNSENLGSTASFSATLGRCAAPLIALCDQDDVWLPGKLATLANALEHDPNAGYAFSNARLVNESLEPLSLTMWDTVGFGSDQRRTFRGRRQIELLLERTIVTGATMMIRARWLHLYQPIPDHAVHDFWIAMVLSAIGAYGLPIPEPLILYRQHPDQQIGASQTSRQTGMRTKLSRDHVLARRRLMRRRSMSADAFLKHLEALLDEPSRLGEKERTSAERSWKLASDPAAHVRARIEMDRASGLRVAKVMLMELARGAYWRYSGGLNALLSDFLYCLRDRRSDPERGSMSASTASGRTQHGR
jgi:glycosyltransferase involved in cell wall biosynthesis